MINNLPKTKLDHNKYPTRWTKPGPYTGMQQTGICRLRKGFKNFLQIQSSDWLNQPSINLKTVLSYGNNKVFGKYFDGKCNGYDVISDDVYTEYEVLLLTDQEGCSAPAANNWSPCSVTCGIGISINGNRTRSCHAVCETGPRSDQYCRQVFNLLT